MDFPHLKDTKFPNLANINVYKYQNNFDYARWNGEVSFKLLNVLWNSNYADVPYFDSVELRDTWFNEQNGYLGTFETKFNNTPRTTLKIPVPYNDAYNFNYLVLDMPMQTGIDNPINYESENRIERWFYFIDDMEQFAPSTTELHLSLDYWTTFIHSVNIPYLMLERGHAPMLQITVDEFLNNPIENNEYLLAEDFNYGTDTIVKSVNYKPIGNGKKYVLFCAPYNYYDFDSFGGSKYSGESTEPTFYDTEPRWGWNFGVNGYEWKYGNGNYSNAKLPISNEIQSGILNGCNCYAIEGIYARQFFNEMMTYYSHFIHGIQAMFILDESLFDRSAEFIFKGYHLYVADKKIITENISFNKEQFGFDDKYKEITKLYTSPYSILEITDDNGKSFSAKIENCGNVKMREEVSTVYPFLNYNIFFTGINGSGNGVENYVWKSVYDSSHNKNTWESDFSEFMFNWNIPTYSIYVSSESEYASNNAGSVIANRQKALVEYENALRPVNTDRENVLDESTANATNTATANSARSSNTAAENSARSSNTNTENNLRSDTATYQNDANSRQFIATTLRNSADTALTNMNVDETTGVTNTSNAVTGGAGVIGSAATGAAVGAVGGPVGIAVGAFAGATVSLVGTVSGIVANSALAAAIQSLNESKNALTNNYNNFLNENNNELNSDLASITNTAQSAITNTTNAKDTTIAGNNNSRDTSITATTNAMNNSNATYTRKALVWNAQWNLRTRQFENENAFKDANLQAPAKYGIYSGDMINDVYMRRGIRLNIRTQSKSAIAQTGDAFLRFGYALHRTWDMSKGFHYGKSFTFWKAEDIWINDGSGVANAATNAIAEILLKGVTVWRNPEEIGIVGIYDNI